jgi:hypothetical protein
VLVGITAANPRRISRTSTLLRTASTGLIAVTSLANAWSSGQLIHGLVSGRRRRTQDRCYQRWEHLPDQHHRLRPVVLGVGPTRAGGPIPRSTPLSGFPVSADDPVSSGTRTNGSRPSSTTSTCPSPVQRRSASPTPCLSPAGPRRSC